VELGTIGEDELDILLNDLLEVYGYDFTDYSRASLKRRVNRLLQIDKFPSFAEFRYKVRANPEYLKRFVEEITVNVTEMFRDPFFYKILRLEILPVLSTYPLIRIWHAGCSTGEEVYSMAIMLQEANLLQKSLLYATDLNPDVIKRAMAGIFPLSQMKQYSENYILSGGIRDFSFYYSAKYNHAKFNEELRAKVIFATHNLVSDRSFNEFQLILCRNVLIYFDHNLQQKVFNLFDQSLEPLGFLALGNKETLRFSSLSSKYKQVGMEKIWRKVA
jgi:chemotaxis protein methyltransferase CheR